MPTLRQLPWTTNATSRHQMMTRTSQRGDFFFLFCFLKLVIYYYKCTTVRNFDSRVRKCNFTNLIWQGAFTEYMVTSTGIMMGWIFTIFTSLSGVCTHHKTFVHRALFKFHSYRCLYTALSSPSACPSVAGSQSRRCLRRGSQSWGRWWVRNVVDKIEPDLSVLGIVVC